MFDDNFKIRIPDEVQALLNTPAQDRGTACNIGTLCAALMIKQMGDDPLVVGMNRIGLVADRMSALGDGYTAGFFSMLERVIAVGAKHSNVDGLAIRELGQSLKIDRLRAEENRAEEIGGLL